MKTHLLQAVKSYISPKKKRLINGISNEDANIIELLTEIAARLRLPLVFVEGLTRWKQVADKELVDYLYEVIEHTEQMTKQNSSEEEVDENLDVYNFTYINIQGELLMPKHINGLKKYTDLTTELPTYYLKINETEATNRNYLYGNKVIYFSTQRQMDYWYDKILKLMKDYGYNII